MRVRVRQRREDDCDRKGATHPELDPTPASDMTLAASASGGHPASTGGATTRQRAKGPQGQAKRGAARPGSAITATPRPCVLINAVMAAAAFCTFAPDTSDTEVAAAGEARVKKDPTPTRLTAATRAESRVRGRRSRTREVTLAGARRAATSAANDEPASDTCLSV